MFSQYSFNRKPFNSTSLLIEQVDLGTVTQSFLDVFVIQRHREVLPIVEVTTEYLDLIAIIVNPVVCPLNEITQEYALCNVASIHYEAVPQGVITEELLIPAIFKKSYAVSLDLWDITQLFPVANVFKYFEIGQGVYTQEFPTYKVIDVTHADVVTFRQIFSTFFQGYPSQIIEQTSVLPIQQKLDWDVKFRSVITSPLGNINQLFPGLRVRDRNRIGQLEYESEFFSVIANTAVYADTLGYSTVFLPSQLIDRFSIEMLECIEAFFGVAINLGDAGDIVLVPHIYAGELLQVLSDFTQTTSKDKDGKHLSVSLVADRTRNTIRVDI